MKINRINKNILITFKGLSFFFFHHINLLQCYSIVIIGKNVFSFHFPKWFINFYYCIRVYILALHIIFFAPHLKHSNLIDWISCYRYNQESNYPYNGNFLEYVFYMDNEIMLDKMYDR
jgi:hypothetical protein